MNKKIIDSKCLYVVITQHKEDRRVKVQAFFLPVTCIIHRPQLNVSSNEVDGEEAASKGEID